jgi:hypothetical protein
MRYLRKYKSNEGIKNYTINDNATYTFDLTLDEKSYIKTCFLLIIEDRNIEFDMVQDWLVKKLDDINGTVEILRLYLSVKNTKNLDHNLSIEDLILLSKNVNELMLDINTSLKRLADEYPTIKHSIRVKDCFRICITFYK